MHTNGKKLMGFNTFDYINLWLEATHTMGKNPVYLFARHTEILMGWNSVLLVVVDPILQ